MNHRTLTPEFATALRSELTAAATNPPAAVKKTTRTIIGAAVVVLAVAVAVPLGVSLGETPPDGMAPAPVVTNPETSHDSGVSRVYIYNSLKELAADSSLVVKATASSSRRGTFGGAPTDVTRLKIDICFLVGGVVGTDPVSHPQASTGPDSCIAGDDVDVRTFRGAGVALEEGNTYLLFLTSTGLSQDASNMYYVTGAVAGAYEQISNDTYQRLVTDVTDVPDGIPLQLGNTDVE